MTTPLGAWTRINPRMGSSFPKAVKVKVPQTRWINAETCGSGG